MTTMDRDEALNLLRGGKNGITEWNRLRADGERIPVLGGADLIRANLIGANLRSAHLSDAKLSLADLSNADLIRANLSGASLGRANLGGANLSIADLRDADLSYANLRDADLRDAKIRHADLSGASLRSANFCGAFLLKGNLFGAMLEGADFHSVCVGETNFGATDLSKVSNLETVNHRSPSTIGTDTLTSSQGQIPEAFLLGCGLAPWEVIAAKLYDPDLTASQVNDLQYKIFEARTSGPIVVGGVFISYSHDDASFVDKIRDKLGEKGVPVWLDRHDLVAGPLQEQVDRALRLNDAVLLVLSKSSVESDWVEYELETAIKKEKEQKRPILCPVAIDASWEDKMGDVLWRQVKKKNVLDFAKWKTKAFDAQFQKLLKGLKIYYEKPSDSKTSVPS